MTSVWDSKLGGAKKKGWGTNGLGKPHVPPPKKEEKSNYLII